MCVFKGEKRPTKPSRYAFAYFLKTLWVACGNIILLPTLTKQSDEGIYHSLIENIKE